MRYVLILDVAPESDGLTGGCRPVYPWEEIKKGHKLYTVWVDIDDGHKPSVPILAKVQTSGAPKDKS